jgi:ubiquinone/menaquinone biosynthesis C-methylase UbiE
LSSTVFWSQNQVGGPYASLEESQEALAVRQALYPTLLDLMPVEFPGKTILDYGCGPGHDTILFAQHGAGHVFYYDISPMALEIVDTRLDMHGLADRASPIYQHNYSWPMVDHVHCAGVLHHVEDPMKVLKDMRYVLKDGGDARVMIYDGDRSKHTQSKVPITNWWGESEFGYMAHLAGFDYDQVGHYDCSSPWRKQCFAACYHLTCQR